ncbi:451_t:CDS:10 [Diversispora eburnea]|uniref:451_t:CDS:1 n=1 Tax=Diversispora eburnea TaxID=1213867 RepID=A0A9N9A3I1_9GLOM|nr:451_t:CDS:10 [Diversispora eburnea]
MNEYLVMAIAADCIKRYYEMRNKEVLLSVGTAEYGPRVQQAIAESGLSAKEFCERKMNEYKETLNNAKVTYTDFSRNTELRHEISVNHIWSKYIYKTSQEGWYSPLSQSFFLESKTKKIKHPHTGEEILVSNVKNDAPKPLEWYKEEHYNFKLPRIHMKLAEWLKANQDLVIAPNKTEKYVYEIKKLLKDLRISRPRSQADWGIPVPDDPEHTVDSNFEAYVNYLTVTGYPWKEEPYKKHWPIDINVCNVRSLKIHAENGPAFLIAADIPPIKKIYANSFKSYNYDAKIKRVINLYGVDACRYIYMAYGNDPKPSDFALENISIRYHKDLVNQLGKAINNCCNSDIYYSTWVPKYPEYEKNKIDYDDLLLHNALTEFPDIVENYYENFDFSNANNHFSSLLPQDGGPIKDRSLIERAFYYSFETLRIASILLKPIMPEKSVKVLNILGVWESEQVWDDAKFGAGWTYVNERGRKWAKYLYQDLYPYVNIGLGGPGLRRNDKDNLAFNIMEIKEKNSIIGDILPKDVEQIAQTRNPRMNRIQWA